MFNDNYVDEKISHQDLNEIHKDCKGEYIIQKYYFQNKAKKKLSKKIWGKHEYDDYTYSGYY